MPRVTIAIDAEGCISAANCVGAAPQFFAITHNGYAEILDRTGRPKGLTQTLEVSDAELAAIQEAAESCPTKAILVSPAID